jgi:hypothetical protein
MNIEDWEWSAAADAARTNPPNVFPNYFPSLNLAAALCVQLAKVREPFSLPTKKLGDFLRPGGGREWGSKHISLLVRHGFLEMASECDKDRKIARTFRLADEEWFRACQDDKRGRHGTEFLPRHSLSVNRACRLCYRLSRANNPFHLPARKMDDFLWRSRPTGQDMLTLLCREGFIEAQLGDRYLWLRD